jgi:hypothetical protein
MLLLLVAHPFLEGGTIRASLLNALLSAVCFFGVYVVSAERRNLIVALALGVPWFVSSWIAVFAPSLVAGLVSASLLTSFYVFTAAVILGFVLRTTDVNQDTLWGAVCVYLFLGGIFHMVFVVIETMQPGSFLSNATCASGAGLASSDLVYHSFVTLTTLGYGDIVPVAPLARTLSMAEAIVGVMYLAIIISRLVGFYIAQQAAAAKRRDP